MKRSLACLFLLGLLALPVHGDEGPAPADAPEGELPLDLGTTEETGVRLVLLDVVVVDRDGRTVPDLTAADFEVFSEGRPLTLDTLDVDCPGGAQAEPEQVRHAGRREAPADARATRRLVLAFDYLHLDQGQRELAFDQARDMVANGAADGDEIMVAALTGGLRVEQTFTDDRDEVLRALRRMRYDVTLWNGNFFHINEFGFVDGLTALFDVLGTVAGPKGMLLYSAMGDVPLDLQFNQLAAVAVVARCSVYPVDAMGLRTPAEEAGIRGGGGGG